MIIFKIAKKLISGVVLLLGIGIVALIAIGLGSYFWHPNAPPSMEDAPWTVHTSSRLYYTTDLTSHNGAPAISNYWYSDGGRWRFVSDKKPRIAYETSTDKLIDGKWCLVFESKLYGNVTIVRRTK